MQKELDKAKPISGIKNALNKRLSKITKGNI